MKLALFDFDGTISTKDSFLDFLHFSLGKAALITGLIRLSPCIVKCALHQIPRSELKVRFITHFFGGMTEADFLKLAESYGKGPIQRLIRPRAVEKIRWHQGEGHKVALVSASIDAWLKDWAASMGMDLISTQLEIKGGIITGRLAGPNCYGAEKVNRIKERYDLSEVEYIYAYGDSRGDKEMFELANEHYMKPFE